MESEKQSEVGNFFGESRCVSARLPIWRKLPLEFRLSLDSSIKQPRPRRSWARGSLSIAGSTAAERERTGRLPGASAAPQSSRARSGVGSPGAPPLPFLAPEDPDPPGAQRCAPPLRRGARARSPRRAQPLLPQQTPLAEALSAWPCHPAAVPGGLRGGLEAGKASAKLRSPGARPRPWSGVRAGGCSASAGTPPEGPDLALCSWGAKRRPGGLRAVCPDGNGQGGDLKKGSHPCPRCPLPYAPRRGEVCRNS